MTARSIEAVLARAAVDDATLTREERAALSVQGYIVLRGVLDEESCAGLRDTFERKYLPGDQWPIPRGHGTRHALLDHEDDVRLACLSPRILAAVFQILGRRFFLSTVQGRDPKPGHGKQSLHRDWVAPEGPAPNVVALAFLDRFGPDNGATRVIPKSHRIPGGPDAFSGFDRHPEEVLISGAAGDVLVFDGYLAHSGTRNVSGAPRRNLQIDYRAHELHAGHVETRDLSAASPDIRYLLGQDV